MSIYTKPTTGELLRRAHFMHHLSHRDAALTYQSCRFCKKPCFRNQDDGHGDCWLAKQTDEPCFGLWKYNVRHYACSDCRAQRAVGA